MKRALFILLLVSPIFVFGQTHIGIRSAYSVSGVSFNPSLDQRLLYGTYDAGILIRHYNLKYVGFQGEINLSQRGFRIPINDTVQFKRKNSYLEIPIFMQVKFQNKRFIVQFQAGCYGAYLLSSSVGNNETGSYKMSNYKFNILKDNRFDYGLVGSAGLGVNISSISLIAEYRLYYGLADLYRHTYPDNPRQSQQISQGIGVSLMFNPQELSIRRKAKANPFIE